jgi:hypothetical protein
LPNGLQRQANQGFITGENPITLRVWPGRRQRDTLANLELASPRAPAALLSMPDSPPPIPNAIGRRATSCSRRGVAGFQAAAADFIEFRAGPAPIIGCIYRSRPIRAGNSVA